ncbi:glycoprotein-N-acetylgalactosamine 3-beta-galactosyltransferase 1-like [Physella acuta]|uniref:glycoprotein-N-acetylgalactosamine 3-beta-galactosyltransferase 1-like n=1 Tax=Physella acuta TaxID=109671 RepID=UPI0027DDA698|nr:glycoprotein-N-acetylgalactosamine 3-beta-galactosyltransferase 1-like [Physella acuta]
MAVKSSLHLLISFFLGFILAVYVTTYTNVTSEIISWSAKQMVTSKYNTDIPDAMHISHNISFSSDTLQHTGDVPLSTHLRKEVRVLIWVMTSPNNLHVKAKAVKETWARHGDLVLFFSSEDNKTFPAIGLNVSEGRDHLTAKTMKAFRYIYENHFNDADWFMKVDDDTYVVLENLRYFLSGENSSEPVYFGHLFEYEKVHRYFSGGAGYVMSKEALRIFGDNADRVNCSKDLGGEDVEMAFCMKKLGVRTGTSLDVLGRSRFHCLNPEAHVNGHYGQWYLDRESHGAKKGIENISDYAVSFHYVSPSNMYTLEFLIYHMRPYGIMLELQNLNNKTTVV